MQKFTETLSATGSNASVRTLTIALKALTLSGCVLSRFNLSGSFFDSTLVVELVGTREQVQSAQAIFQAWSN